MAIEDIFDRLADALEANTKALLGKTSTGKGPGRPAGSKNKDAEEEEEEAEEEEEEEEEEAEEDDGDAKLKDEARKLMVKVKSDVGREAVQPIFKKFSVKSFDQLETDDYPAVIKLAKKALAAAK